MAITNWESVYNTEIITRREHNGKFSLEEFLSFPTKTKREVVKKYKAVSLLDSFRNEGKDDLFVSACNENSCETIIKFLKN
jgi:hypothetical protein